MRLTVGLLPFLLGVLGFAASVLAEGEELIGTPAPEFEVTHWVQSEPLTLSGLHGSAVLVRFWTDTCSSCAASAPVLAALHERYARDGLVVIGIYHPKPPREVDPALVERTAQHLGMDFPIGLDPQWKTLKRYWLGGAERPWTSASFLIDRRGIIRFVHPGGSYSPEETEALEEAIIQLLARRG
jgi:peroxiredoxin